MIKRTCQAQKAKDIGIGRINFFIGPLFMQKNPFTNPSVNAARPLRSLMTSTASEVLLISGHSY